MPSATNNNEDDNPREEHPNPREESPREDNDGALTQMESSQGAVQPGPGSEIYFADLEDDDDISVLTSEFHPECCLPDIWQDGLSGLTPRTANRSCKSRMPILDAAESAGGEAEERQDNESKQGMGRERIEEAQYNIINDSTNDSRTDMDLPDPQTVQNSVSTMHCAESIPEAHTHEYLMKRKMVKFEVKNDDQSLGSRDTNPDAFSFLDVTNTESRSRIDQALLSTHSEGVGDMFNRNGNDVVEGAPPAGGPDAGFPLVPVPVPCSLTGLPPVHEDLSYDDETQYTGSVLAPSMADLEQPSRPSMPLSACSVAEETLCTALAEPLPSLDCGSTLTTTERSLLIKQGRCPTCGIQTHKQSGMLRKSFRHPLSNEHVLSGRCLICNPIIITHQVLNTDNETNGERNCDTTTEATSQTSCETTEKDFTRGRCDELSVNTGSPSLKMETKDESADIIHHPRPPPTVPPKENNTNSFDPPPPPSAPLAERHLGSADAQEGQSKLQDSKKKYFSETESRDEVERWLLTHLPTLQKRDVDKYCDCLAEDGFDSVVTLEFVEGEDLSFMKKAHQRVFMKRLQEAQLDFPE